MRKLVLFAAAATALLTGQAYCAPAKKKTAARPARRTIVMPEGEWDARVVYLSGRVLVRPQGESLWLPITRDFPLLPGDSLRTMEGALAELSLDGKMYVDVLDNTMIFFETLDYTGSVINITDGYVVGYAGEETELKSPVVFSAPTMLAQAVKSGFALRYNSATEENTLACFGPGELRVDRITDDGRAVRGISIIAGKELVYAPDTKFLMANPIGEFAKYRPLAQKLGGKTAASSKHWDRMEFEEKARIRDQVFSHAEAVYVRGYSIRNYRKDYVKPKTTEDKMAEEALKEYSVLKSTEKPRVIYYGDQPAARTGVKLKTPSGD